MHARLRARGRRRRGGGHAASHESAARAVVPFAGDSPRRRRRRRRGGGAVRPIRYRHVSALGATERTTASFDGGVGCAYELSRLSLPGLARLCEALERASRAEAKDAKGLGDGVKSGAGAMRGLIEAYTLSQPTLQQVLLNLQGRS